MADEEQTKTEEIAPWVAVQKKTFTKWTNSHLKKVGSQITDVITEFDNGIKLMQLVKALYGIEIPKYNANPKMRPHKLDNLSLAFNMVEKAKIKTNFLKTTHLIDHDLKMILGMIWAIILDYQIKGISVEDLSAKEALLLWCQKKTKGYRDVKVNDFSASWNTGLALAALIHHHRPDLIDFDSLDKNNARENIKLVFDVAQNHLGIEPLLDVEDLAVERPDDKSVMTYISEFYHKFTSQNKNEVAARRIQKFAQFNKSVEDLENNYTNNAQELLQWVNQKIEVLNERNFDDDFESVKQLIAAHKEYKVSEKPRWSENKSDNEALHTSLQARLRANKRKNWNAPHGLTVEEVDQAWERLGEAEKDRGKALRDHLNKQKDNLRRRFADLANEFYEHATHTKKEISDSGSKGDLNDQLNFLKGKEEEINKDRRTEELQSVNQILEDLGLADENPYTDFTLEELLLLWEQLQSVLKKKKQAIQGQLQATGQSNITEDQMNEFQETFRHFDKDRSNALDKLEFRACLKTLGQDYGDDEFNKLFASLANGEKIDFDTFVKYMVSLLEDTDDSNQIKQSFKILSNDAPNVSVNELRVPPLQENEIQFLANHMKNKDERYDYNAYADEVFA
jgi:Ca2+-binding EF-hand superfamily protein